MKIGQVSKLLNIPISTIRYYIDMGLILPGRKNYHYHFSEQEIEELQLILQYKDLNFSLQEIHNIISLYRVSYVTNTREIKQMLDFLNSKRNDFVKEKEEIDKIIFQLDEIIQNITSRITTPVNITGFPVTMLDLLSCSQCSNDLILKNATIKENRVISGEIICSCGFHCLIENGIIYHMDNSNFKTTSLFNISNTLLEEYDAKTINHLKQDERMLLHDIISGKELNNKIVLETNVKRWFFLLKNIEALGKDNYYIIIDPYAEIIKYYKTQMDKLDHSYNLLFMVCNPGSYPIKRSSIDIWIDYMDSVENSETEVSFLPSLIAPYLKKGSIINGISMGIRSKTYVESLSKLHPELPYNILDYFGEGAFIEQLKANGFEIIHAKKLRDIWETSKQSGIKITQSPPYRLIYKAVCSKK